MSDQLYFICQIIVAIVVIVGLAWVLQRIFNPKKNAIGRKYLELENENTEEKRELTEDERKFYEEIWKAKKKS